jgi:hypothetical protein
MVHTKSTRHHTNSIPAKAGMMFFAPFLVPCTQFHHGFLLVRQLFWLKQVTKSLVNSILNTYTFQSRSLIMHYIHYILLSGLEILADT